MGRVGSALSAALLAAGVGAAAAAALCRQKVEKFGFATDVCGSIDPDSNVYRDSADLRALCDRADLINPEEACLVDCDVGSLCRNPSVGYCRKARSSHRLCDVTDDYYGSHPENADLPKVYRVRRGACLAATAAGAFVDGPDLRAALMRFPASVAVVGSALGHESRFKEAWTVTLPASPGAGAADVDLPLASHAFVQEAARRARGSGVSALVPAALLHESCASPGGNDTSFPTEPAPLARRTARAAGHRNQPPRLHVTLRFTLPSTSRVRIGGAPGLVYSSFAAGQPRTSSPVSEAPLSVRTDVWLMIEVSPKDGRVTEAREVLSGSDGKVRISKAAPAAGWAFDAQDPDVVSFAGDPPELWLGMRDAARDAGGSSPR